MENGLKQKQIEEMARDFGNAQYGCNEESPCCKECILEGVCTPYEYARVAYNAGYRKIPEGAMVLEKPIYDCIMQGNRTIQEHERKETAEKFAERVKMAFYYEFDELIPSIMADKIDEICKGITEGKV